MPSPNQRLGGARMLEQLERQEVEEQQIEPRVVAPPAFPVEDDQRQRRRMVIALVMLLVALGLVLVKDRDFWFFAPETTDSEVIDDSTPATAEDGAQPATPAVTTPAPALPATRKRHTAPVAASRAPEPASPT